MKYLKKFESHGDKISELRDQFEDLELDFDIDVKVDYSYFSDYYIVDVIINQKIDFNILLDLIKSRVDRVRSTTDFKTRGISDMGNHDTRFNPNIIDYYGILYMETIKTEIDVSRCFGDIIFKDFTKWVESYDGEPAESWRNKEKLLGGYNGWFSVKKVRILFDV